MIENKNGCFMASSKKEKTDGHNQIQRNSCQKIDFTPEVVSVIKSNQIMFG